MTWHTAVLALAVGVSWVLGSIQGWNWHARAITRPATVDPRGPPSDPDMPVMVGKPLWWVHLISLLWAGVGVAMHALDMHQTATMAFLASLTTSLSTLIYLHRKRRRLRGAVGPR